MGFRKYEVLVRKNSTADIDYVVKLFKSSINKKQESDPDTLWTAEVFDLRTLDKYLIFSDKSAKTFQITEDNYRTRDGTIIPAVMYLGKSFNDTLKEELKEGLKEEILKEIETK